MRARTFLGFTVLFLIAGIAVAGPPAPDEEPDAAEILRRGVEEAGNITAEGVKEAAAITGRAQSLDEDFYAFWRKLQLLKKTLGARSTVILRNDQGPFGVLSEEPSAVPAPGGPTP